MTLDLDRGWGRGFCCEGVDPGTSCVVEGNGQRRRCPQERGAWKENWRPAEAVHETQKHPQTPSWPCAEVNRGEPGAMGRGPRSLNAAAAHRPGLLGFGCCSICHLTGMSSAHAELAGAVPTPSPSGCARAPWPIRTWGEVPGSSDLLSAEGRPGDDGRACQDGRGVYACRPHRPRAPSTAPRCPPFPCGRSRVAPPRPGDKPAPTFAAHTSPWNSATEACAH